MGPVVWREANLPLHACSALIKASYHHAAPTRARMMPMTLTCSGGGGGDSPHGPHGPRRVEPSTWRRGGDGVGACCCCCCRPAAWRSPCGWPLLGPGVLDVGPPADGAPSADADAPPVSDMLRLRRRAQDQGKGASYVPGLTGGGWVGGCLPGIAPQWFGCSIRPADRPEGLCVWLCPQLAGCLACFWGSWRRGLQLSGQHTLAYL